jgi:dolichyl-phosphate beta-glucosyltransferase
VRILVVIPAYNESRRLPALFAGIAAERRRPEASGVRFLVVDDGSGAGEVEKVRALIAEHGLAEVVSLTALPDNRGKGSVLKAGFEEGLASGYDWLGFMDADGSVSAASLYDVVGYVTARDGTALGAVAGSRVNMLGRLITRGPLRHYMSRLFATFVSLYFGVAMYDSQCGLKLFKASVLAKYLALPTDFRWVWDTELVMAMLHGGETVHEVPIDWREVMDSKVSFLSDPLVMVARLIAFKRRLPRK